MPKKYRLTGEEIKKLSDRSASPPQKRYHGKLFSLIVVSGMQDHPKFAVVVSKKAAAKAVDRNKIKRRARSAVAKLLPGTRKPVSLLLYAKAEARKAEFNEILSDIQTLFSRL